ncbi:MAG: hypothetical protein KGI29_00495 [Pseudomonadota bacterium]|nr:hypothetical protein [Pseudomonadota bacterium]MDE3038073.1 hypothetical protein [Pseudomonadota bacterium]
MLNDLEDRIIKGAKKAHITYLEMNDYYLHHAPEHFLQNEIARTIWQKGNGNDIYIDKSNAQVLKELDSTNKKGRPRDDASKRFDITVFKRSEKQIKAVIEIKRGDHISFQSLRKDTKKIEHSAKSPNGAKLGYLLVYSVRKKEEKIRDDFKKWEKRLKWELRENIIESDGKWTWGIGLFKFSLR